ncbi:ABC transporter ATP-binding protein [Geminicoccaceae bacterium 1502E]|nr:ABC transporter ATP-binding protein [Geminicoccaceae bacterium 1502E]
MVVDRPLLECRSLTKEFGRGGALSAILSGEAGRNIVRAVDDVSFAVGQGEVLGLVGGSGSGKSTLANMIVQLERPTKGDIVLNGRPTHSLGRSERRKLRRDVQMVFQDPNGSLNPRYTIRSTLEEPLIIHSMGSAKQRARRVEEALEEAELRPASRYIDRYPHELSGGQRQRVAIARAIVLQPRLLVADEPVSMLDVSVRAGILELLRKLVKNYRMAMVFITHDLSLLGQVCDRVAVLHLGKLVEIGSAFDVVTNPQATYTRQLLAAVPVLKRR